MSPTAQPKNVSIAERAHPERVIVEIVGQLERRSRVLERSVESLLEAYRPREPALDDRLKRGTRDRLAQRLLEQRDGSVETFELGQEDESLGPQWADVRFGQQVGCDRPGTSPLPRAVMRTGRRQRPTTALVARGRRRQPNRLLGELRRDGRCAALGRKRRRRRRAQRRRRRRERRSRARGDARGGAGRRRCRRFAVNASSLVAQVEVENRRQQRVGEANRAVRRARSRARRSPARARLPQHPPAPGATPTASPAPRRARARRA